MYLAHAPCFGIGEHAETLIGEVSFVRVKDKSLMTTVHVNIQGIVAEPDGEHAIQVHDYGDVFSSFDGLSLGGHFLIGSVRQHDLPRPDGSTPELMSNNGGARHGGDMGNFQATNGSIVQTKYLDAIELREHRSIVGRAVVIHELRDRGIDRQPTGASGDRIGVCPLGMAHPSIVADYRISPDTVRTGKTLARNAANASPDFDYAHTRMIALLRPPASWREKPFSARTAAEEPFGVALISYEASLQRVVVSVNIRGLVADGASMVGESDARPNLRGHAVHVHHWGDVRAADGTAAGGHFNPHRRRHGWPFMSLKRRHLGDLGTIGTEISASAAPLYQLFSEGLDETSAAEPSAWWNQGSALVYRREFDDISAEDFHLFLGRAVVIHELADCGGGKVGGAGSRKLIGVLAAQSANVDDSVMHEDLVPPQFLDIIAQHQSSSSDNSLYPGEPGAACTDSKSAASAAAADTLEPLEPGYVIEELDPIYPGFNFTRAPTPAPVVGVGTPAPTPTVSYRELLERQRVAEENRAAAGTDVDETNEEAFPDPDLADAYGNHVAPSTAPSSSPSRATTTPSTPTPLPSSSSSSISSSSSSSSPNAASSATAGVKKETGMTSRDSRGQRQHGVKYRVSLTGAWCLVEEPRPPPEISRWVFVVSVLVISIWTAFQLHEVFHWASYEARPVASSSRRHFLRWAHALLQVNNLFHALHFADNIWRPVQYFEPRWLFTRRVLATMELSFVAFLLLALLINLGAHSLARGGSNMLQAPSPSAGRLPLTAYSLLSSLSLGHYLAQHYSVFQWSVHFTCLGESLAALSLLLFLWAPGLMTRFGRRSERSVNRAV